MVRNAEDKKDLTKVSLCFVPSLKCNNRCSFCMYEAGPNRDVILDLDKTKRFVETVLWDKVCGFGLYGGEPSIETDLYQQFCDLIPNSIQKFVITNGAWSKSEEETKQFLSWCVNKFHIIISSCTEEHRVNQNFKVIQELSEKDGVTVKFLDEEIHPMGRAYFGDVKCYEKCLWHVQPIRFALFPTGDVILQNCHGAYPVISNIEEGFMVAFKMAVKVRKKGLSVCRKLESINDVLRRL